MTIFKAYKRYMTRLGILLAAVILFGFSAFGSGGTKLMKSGFFIALAGLLLAFVLLIISKPGSHSNEIKTDEPNQTDISNDREV